MYRVQISGTGLYTPSESISNAELVDSYNKFVDEYNTKHQKEQIMNLEKATLFY